MHRPTGGRFGQPRTPNTANQLPLPAYRTHRETWNDPTCSTRDGARRAWADLPPGATVISDSRPRFADLTLK